MRSFILVVLAILAPLPAAAQDQASCKAYFQVLRAEAGSPGLHIGLDGSQTKWWDSHGRKKYPGLCLNGSVVTGDKPRFLVIWSKSRTIGDASIPSNEVYGQSAKSLQATAPGTRNFQPRWDAATVTIVNVLYDGSLMSPPIYFEADDRITGALTGAGPVTALQGGSTKVLEAALKYLSQEYVLLPKAN